jgi:hypothetical protein
MQQTISFSEPALQRELRSIRRWIVFFMIALILSGITAFPIQTELHVFMQFRDYLPIPGIMQQWLEYISSHVDQTMNTFPQVFYGCDWLAFSHIVIALFFIGVYKNPVQNTWVIRIGLIACAGIIPLAFIGGSVRDIPMFWRLIDCSFGVFGSLPLLLVLRKIKKLDAAYHPWN